MARITCAISGIRFTTSHFDSLSLPHTDGYIHPVFALDREHLYPYYREHCLGRLTATDSYLLFLAFLHSSDRISWAYPASCNPSDPKTKILIESNISQLISVLEKTDLIQHPQFDQPSFKVYYESCSLTQIPNWIRAWQDNISYFYTRRADQCDIEALQKLENKLSYHILGAEPPEKYARVIANWAATAANFPDASCVLWKETIRSCFSMTKMFNTPLSLLKEIKEYIELNIPVGSIHFHAISEVLREGIAKHNDYLGGSSLALGYTLLTSLDTNDSSGKQPSSELKGSAEVATIVASASESYPLRRDYPNTVEFIKAKLAFRVAANLAVATALKPIVEATEYSSLISPAKPAEPTKPTLLVDADEPLPASMSSSFSELTEIEDELVLDTELLDGLTITDDLNGEV